PIGQGMIVHLQVNDPNDPLADVQVRRALNHAVDVQLFVDSLLLGFTRVLPGQLVHDDAFGFNPSLNAFPYDLDLARELLAEAGYPNGFSTRMVTTEGRYVKSREVAEAIVGQLAQIGVQVDLEILEYGEFVS